MFEDLQIGQGRDKIFFALWWDVLCHSTFRRLRGELMRDEITYTRMSLESAAWNTFSSQMSP